SGTRTCPARRHTNRCRRNPPCRQTPPSAPAGSREERRRAGYHDRPRAEAEKNNGRIDSTGRKRNHVASHVFLATGSGGQDGHLGYQIGRGCSDDEESGTTQSPSSSKG